MKENKYIYLSDIVKLLWKKRVLIIIVVFLVSVLSVAISYLLPEKYVATAIILSPDNDKGALVGFNPNLSIFGVENLFSGNQGKLKLLAILQSNQLYTALDKKFDLQKKYGTLYREYTFKKIRKNLRIKEGDQDQIIISMIDTNQNLIADMVNYVVHCLDSLNIVLSTNKANDNRIFIERRLNIVKDSLRYIQNEISDFMQKNDIVSMSDQIKYAVENAASLKAKITFKEIELALHLKNYSQDSPTVKMLRDEIVLLKQEYTKFFSKDNELFIGLNEVPELQMKYLELENNMLYLSQLQEFIGTQFEKAKIEEAKDIPTIQILDNAIRPNVRYSPQRVKIIILSSFIAFILISFFILLIENNFSHDE